MALGWSTAFRELIAQDAAQLVWVFSSPGTTGLPGSPWSCGSHPGLGQSDETCWLIQESISVQGNTVSPRGWSYTLGGYTVAIGGDPALFFQEVAKGAICELLAGGVGWALGDFQVVAVGVVYDVRRSGVRPTFQVDLHDILGAGQFHSAGDGVFAGVGTATTVAGTNYAIGDTNIEVASTAGFDKEATHLDGTASRSLLKITPTGGTAFYRAWSSTLTTPTRFHIYDPSTATVLGTADHAAVIGSTVVEVLYLHGHPIDVARRVLLTYTGTAANGPYDVLPTLSGLGIPERYVDHLDMDIQRDNVMAVASGSWIIELGVEEEVESGASWLASFLAAIGCFATQRQGSLTIRAGQATHDPDSRRNAGTIEDDDIIEVLEYSYWDNEHSPEWYEASVTSFSGNTSDVAGTVTFPAGETLDYDVSDRVFNNETEVRHEIFYRVSESAMRVPGRLRLRLKLGWAVLAPGDIPLVKAQRLVYHRDPRANEFGIHGLVVEVSPDWQAASVEVAILIYPLDEGR